MSTVLEPIYIGDSRTITVDVTDKSGQPIDITDMSMTLTIAETKQGTPVIQIVNTVHTAPLIGKTVFQIQSTDTENLSPLNHHFDIVLDGGVDFEFTVALGTVKFVERVAIP